jgi:hypothetical protein
LRLMLEAAASDNADVIARSVVSHGIAPKIRVAVPGLI